jgi:hypothetical protein
MVDIFGIKSEDGCKTFFSSGALEEPLITAVLNKLLVEPISKIKLIKIKS